MAAPQAPNAAKPMTTNRGVTMLKTTLVAGSIIATLLGANLAAREEQATTPKSRITTGYDTGAQFDSSQSVAVLPNLPAPDLNTADVDALLNMPLAPIPSISLLAPVTSSRSSR